MADIPARLVVTGKPNVFATIEAARAHLRRQEQRIIADRARYAVKTEPLP